MMSTRTTTLHHTKEPNQTQNNTTQHNKEQHITTQHNTTQHKAWVEEKLSERVKSEGGMTLYERNLVNKAQFEVSE